MTYERYLGNGYPKYANVKLTNRVVLGKAFQLCALVSSVLNEDAIGAISVDSSKG